MQKRRLVITCLILASLLCSCSGGSGVTAPIGALPDMLMQNAAYTWERGDGSPIVLNAKNIEIYTKENARSILTGVNFSQSDKISGSCDRAEINGDSTSAQLSGHVCFNSTKDNIIITCDDLSWNEATGEIFTEGDVTVSYGDGTIINAVGLTAIPDKDIYEFSQIKEGVFESN